MKYLKFEIGLHICKFFYGRNPQSTSIERMIAHWYLEDDADNNQKSQNAQNPKTENYEEPDPLWHEMATENGILPAKIKVTQWTNLADIAVLGHDN